MESTQQTKSGSGEADSQDLYNESESKGASRTKEELLSSLVQ